MEEYIELGLARKVELFADVPHDKNGVFVLPVVLDLLTIPIRNSGVRHRMAVISVADELDEERAVLDGPVLGPLESLSNFKHVVSLNSEAGDDITTCVELCVHG